MYVNESLKLNKFREVRIPKLSEYFRRMGGVAQNPNGFTGDDVDYALGTSKIDELTRINAEMNDYESQAE